MLGLKTFQAKSYVGLDIQTDEIRLLLLKGEKSGTTIQCADYISLPAGGILDGKIQQFDKVSNALQELIQRTQTQGHKAAIALPAHSIISKKIHLPTGLGEQEREEKVVANLNEYFPGAADELAYDYAILEDHSLEQDNALLIATRNEQLMTYINVVECVGLKVNQVDVDIYALMHAVNCVLHAAPSTDVVAVLDLSGAGPQFIVRHRNEIIFHQKFNSIAINELAAQLRYALQLYTSSYRELEIKTIYLLGECNKLSDIVEGPQTIHGLSLFLHLPNCHAVASKDVAEKMWTSYGLALRGICE